MSRAPLLSLTALRVLAVTALSFSMLAACGKAQEAAEEAVAEAATEAAIEAMSDADVEVEDGGQTLSGVDENGEAFSVAQGDAATLPADFPQDVLVPEGLVLETSMVVGGNAFVGGTLEGDMAALAARIDAHMKGEGWTSTMAMTEQGSTMQVWQRDDRGVNYMIERKDDGKLGLTISHAREASSAQDGVAPTP
jgi:hypothetical protein